MAQPVYVGLDMGASRTKVAVIDRHGKMLGHAVKKSGIDFAATAALCLEDSLQQAVTWSTPWPPVTAVTTSLL
jgi:N-acetylglucosamine kinase-like BadF-type ATPase